MFKIEMEKAKEFKNAIDAIGNIIDEGAFVINTEGITLHALDPSQIAMVIFNMPSHAFSDYNVENTHTVGLNLDSFNKILARGKDTKLVLTDEKNKLNVQFSSGSTKKNFKIPLIDTNGGLEREPKVEHDVTIKILAGALKDAIKDISLVSSHISFDIKKDKLKMSASGDNAEAEIEYSNNDKSEIKEMNVKSAARATFPVQYLDDMLKGAEDAGEVEISIKTNAPVKIKYSVSNAHFTYYLAPRIDLE
jgi:proliferating cell nuclear antigen PCNA